MKLISAYKAGSEAEAVSLRDLLAQEGLKAVIRSRQIPWHDGVMVAAVGYWGDLLVRKEDFEKAKEIIGGFLA